MGTQQEESSPLLWFEESNPIPTKKSRSFTFCRTSRFIFQLHLLTNFANISSIFSKKGLSPIPQELANIRVSLSSNHSRLLS